MEGKKSLHAVKKENQGRKLSRAEIEAENLALFVRNYEYAELVPVGPEQINGMQDSAYPVSHHHPDNPAQIVFYSGIESVKHEMFIAASEMADLAQTLAFSFYGLEHLDREDLLFEQREFVGLDGAADQIAEKAERVQLLLNAYWTYLEKKRGVIKRDKIAASKQ